MQSVNVFSVAKPEGRLDVAQLLGSTASLMDVSRCQLSEIARIVEMLDRARIDYWLFGGWAVDFYVGEVTRVDGDVDFAVR